MYIIQCMCTLSSAMEAQEVTVGVHVSTTVVTPASLMEAVHCRVPAVALAADPSSTPTVAVIIMDSVEPVEA